MCRAHGPYTLHVNGFELGQSNNGEFDIRMMANTCAQEIRDWFFKDDGSLDLRKYSVLSVCSAGNNAISIVVNNHLVLQGNVM